MNKITVLFPGGFKPLTGAHLALAQRYAEDSQVEQVILLIGPTERDGITRQKTIEMFNLLNSNSKIKIRPTEFNSPITAAYEYLFELPQDATGRYAMAASTKGDDYVRAKLFVPNVDKYRTIGDKKGRTIPAGIDAIELNIDVEPLTYDTGQPISASNVRLNLMKNDYNSFGGNAYGLANTLKQTAILKPTLKNKKVNNLYYAGQLTVPGPGVPPSIISGQIVANEISKKFGEDTDNE